MVPDLRECLKSRNFVEIKMVDGDSYQGFITMVTPDRFHIVTMEPVTANDPDEEEDVMDDFGDLLLLFDGPVKTKTRDYQLIPVKQSYDIDLVTGIVFDISHVVPPDLLKTFFFIRDNVIYKEKPTPTKKAAKKPVKKSTKPLTNTLK